MNDEEILALCALLGWTVRQELSGYAIYSRPFRVGSQGDITDRFVLARQYTLQDAFEFAQAYVARCPEHDPQP